MASQTAKYGSLIGVSSIGMQILREVMLEVLGTVPGNSGPTLLSDFSWLAFFVPYTVAIPVAIGTADYISGGLRGIDYYASVGVISGVVGATISVMLRGSITGLFLNIGTASLLSIFFYHYSPKSLLEKVIG